jgi:hypothetical protein
VARILKVEEVKRDENKKVLEVKIKIAVEILKDNEYIPLKEYTATFVPKGNKVKRSCGPNDKYLPNNIYKMMIRRAYAIIFDKRPKHPYQPLLPFLKPNNPFEGLF